MGCFYSYCRVLLSSSVSCTFFFNSQAVCCIYTLPQLYQCWEQFTKVQHHLFWLLASVAYTGWSSVSARKPSFFALSRPSLGNVLSLYRLKNKTRKRYIFILIFLELEEKKKKGL